MDQINGEYGVKNEILVKYHEKVVTTVKGFEQTIFQHRGYCIDSATEANGQVEVMNRIIFNKLYKNMVQTGANKGHGQKSCENTMNYIIAEHLYLAGETPFAPYMGPEAMLPDRGETPSYPTKELVDEEQLRLLDELKDNFEDGLKCRASYEHLHNINEETEFGVGDLVTRMYAITPQIARIS
ncbi:hypothetical protein Leryth_023872 [Lithospermum erythrorhizon]|nr:hypothetical protein Leryth_023872 [Lithospermum erythrorhizon]